MQVNSLVLICLVCVYHAVAKEHQDHAANSLACLLATHSPEAAISDRFYSRWSGRSPPFTAVYTGSKDRGGFEGFRRDREHPLKFSVNDVDVEMPVKIEGSQYRWKLSSGFNFTAAGIRYSFPFTCIFRDFMRMGNRMGYEGYDGEYMRPPFRMGRYLSDQLRKAKGELRRPLEFDANGVPFKVPISYESGDIRYPVTWNASGWTFEIPLRYSLSGGFTVPTMTFYDTTMPKVTAKLKKSWEFEIGDKEFAVPLKFDGERFTTGLETKIRNVKLTLPLSFLLRGLSRLNERKIERWARHTFHVKNLKGELVRPVKLGKRRDTQLTLPIALEHGQVVFPFNFTTRGWNLSFPLTWKFAQYRYDGRTLADFNARDIYGKDGWLGQFQGKVVLIAVISNVEDCAELHDLQKMNRDGLQVIAVVKDPRLIEEIKEFEKFSYHRTGSVVRGFFYPSGLVILEDQYSDLMEWLRDQKSGLGMLNFGNDKFLLNRAGKPVARFGPLSMRSYEDAISELL